MWALGVMMFCLLLVALTVELISTHIEKTIRKKDMLECVHRLYKGMMMLGIMAIVLCIFKITGAIEALSGTDNANTFDLAFMLLAFSLLTYLCIVTCILVHTKHCTEYWNEFEQLTFGEADKKFHAAGGAGHAKECFRYHILRARFCSNWGLRVDFPFNKYLRRCGLKACAELASIHWSVWVAFLVGITIHLIRVLIIDLDIFGGSFQLIVACWLTCIMSFIMMLKSRTIWTRLMETLPTPGSSEEAALLKTSAPEASEVALRHQELFWFGTPKSLVIPVQIVLVCMSMIVPIYLARFIDYWTHYPVGDQIMFNILVIVPVLLTLGVFVPLMITPYVLARSVGYLTNLKAVNRIEMRHKVKIIKEEEDLRQDTAHKRREAAMAAATTLWEEQQKHGTAAPPSTAPSLLSSEDGTALMYHWRNVAVPAGEAPVLSDAGAESAEEDAADGSLYREV